MARRYKRIQPVYKKIEFDSLGELEFYKWLEENNIPFTYQPSSVELIPAFTVVQEITKGKKKVSIDRTILRNVSYTADFLLDSKKTPLWLISLMGWRVSVDGYIYLDVKGASLKNNKVRYVQNPDSVKFSILQKIAWNRLNIFINKTSSVELFLNTYCPDSCRLTEKTKKPKKMFENMLNKAEFYKKLKENH